MCEAVPVMEQNNRRKPSSHPPGMFILMSETVIRSWVNVQRQVLTRALEKIEGCVVTENGRDVPPVV